MNQRMLYRLICLFALAWLAGCGLADGKLTLDFSAQQLQSAVAPKFPVENCPLPLICIKLQNPQISLPEGGDRIQLGFDSTLTGIQQSYTGTVVVSAKPRYQSSTGEIFLDDSRIQDITLPGVPGTAVAIIKQYGSPLMQQALQRAPIYSFKNAQAEKIAKMGIANVTVVGGKLRVLLDPSLSQTPR
jgi:hypothetical protein